MPLVKVIAGQLAEWSILQQTHEVFCLITTRSHADATHEKFQTMRVKIA
jgi:hypothetical protein